MTDHHEQIPGRRQSQAEIHRLTTPPTQTSYIRGQAFNPAGMVVTADISGVLVVVTTYTVTPTVLSLEDTGVTVSFTAGGVTCTAIQP